MKLLSNIYVKKSDYLEGNTAHARCELRVRSAKVAGIEEEEELEGLLQFKLMSTCCLVRRIKPAQIAKVHVLRNLLQAAHETVQ